MPIHTRVCEHLHTQYIHCAFQWHAQASLWTGFTTHVADRPPAPRPEDARQSAGGPKCLGIPSTSTLSNISGGYPQGTLKIKMVRAGTAITTVTAGFTYNPVPFRVLPLSARADTGFGLTHFRPHSSVPM